LPAVGGGGVATGGGSGTWVNTTIGLGMKGPVTGEAIGRVIEFHESAGVEPRVEACPFADVSLLARLEERGFALRLFENVFFRELSGTMPIARGEPEGVHIAIVDPGNEAMVSEYAHVVAAGFAEPNPPCEADVSLNRVVARHPRTVCVAALDSNGRIVGAGAVEILGTLCALFGLVVAPEFRRRGVQLALMEQRLRLAAERGASVATISSRPGVPTERNARRMGFQAAYTRVALARAGPGLVANRT